MPFSALLMCRDGQSLKILRNALDELGIEQEISTSASETLQRLMHAPYSAVVLDFDLPGAAMVARVARLADPHRRPVVFALIDGLTEIAGTFRAGANFVLYKPLLFDQVVRSLRAGRGFMRADRRRSTRHKLETLVYLQFGVAAVPAIVLDVNEQGLSLQAPEPLPPVQQIPFRFVLPATTQIVEGNGEMIWADDNGRAGIFFAKLTVASRKYLKQWLTKRTTKKRVSLHASRAYKTRRSLAGIQ
jgi:ActR/RegA family two-component response regulator